MNAAKKLYENVCWLFLVKIVSLAGRRPVVISWCCCKHCEVLLIIASPRATVQIRCYRGNQYAISKTSR